MGCGGSRRIDNDEGDDSGNGQLNATSVKTSSEPTSTEVNSLGFSVYSESNILNSEAKMKENIDTCTKSTTAKQTENIVMENLIDIGSNTEEAPKIMEETQRTDHIEKLATEECTKEGAVQSYKIPF